MIMINFRALAGQSMVRIIAKAAISFLLVGLATFFSREGLSLAIIVIFTGVTGPTIRLVTLKMDGIYDRIIVSPVSKSRFFLDFAGLWVIAVLLPLVPAITIVAIFKGPVTIIPVIVGTVLAVTLGTLAGFLSRGLSDAHLAALFISGQLIVLSVIITPLAGFLPYPAISSPSFELAALITPIIIPVAMMVILAFTVSRS